MTEIAARPYGSAPPEPRSKRARLVTLFCAALVMLLAVAAYGWQQSRHAGDAQQRVTHTLLVLKQALELENIAITLEANHRGFLVSGSPGLLHRRDAGMTQARQIARQLEALVADDPRQVALVKGSAEALEQRYLVMRGTSRLATTQGLAVARGRFQSSGDGSIEPMRQLLAALRHEEHRLLNARKLASDVRLERFHYWLALGTALGFLVLIGSGAALLRELRSAEQTHKALAEASALQQAMLDSAGLMVIAVDTEGTVQLFNRTASDALGYSAKELVGKRTPSVWHLPEEINARAAALSLELGVPIAANFEVFKARPDRGLSEQSEWTFVRRNGEHLAVQLTVTALRDSGGRALGYIGMAQDISQRHTAELAIATLNRGLTQQAEQLLASNRELESFSYSVSHDLRAPLRHINGFARMLAEDAGAQLSPDARRYLETITASARRMGLLIDDLLAFSRLGRKPLIVQNVDMHGLLDSTLEDLRGAQRLGSTPKISIGRLPDVSGDPALLRQVWANLLSNAIKYSAPRGNDASIEVAGERRGDRVHFMVRDNGVGFDMRYADKLFGVFQRLHAQDEFEGTGVGLAIVQRIISRHGGQCSASAEVDRGACFTFELPIAEAVA